MYQLINKLTVNNRLRIISLLILIFSLACVLLLWNASYSFDKDVKEIDNLTELELKVWQLRSTYNAMRGDIMQVFIADPLTQQSYIQQASALFHERLDQIKGYMAGIDPKALDVETATRYAEFTTSLQTYIIFCIDNLPAIQAVQLQDSAQFNHVRNLLVVDQDRHFQTLRARAVDVIESVHTHKQSMFKVMEERRVAGFWITIVISIVLLGITLSVIVVISKSITSPIKETEQILQSLSSGDIPDIKDYNGKDEFSRMLRSLKSFTSHIHLIMDFVRNVSQNNFTVQAQMFDGQGPIAASLVSMRDNLQTAYMSESQRAWSSKGIAELGELIRRSQDLVTLYDKVLSFIVKYVGANQGVLYVHDEHKNSLDLVAAYAYGRKKHVTASLTEGEGLAGQAFLEREVILLKEVPKEYIKITSGLGESAPRMVVISPLISNDGVLGVLEIASFKEIDSYQLEFIKKISEEIGAVISSTKVSTRTQELLRDSQQQAEELRSQEEEMRQNMEELQATQEGMGRMLKEVQHKESLFNDMLDAIQAPILVFDAQYKVIQINHSMKKTLAAKGLTINVGTILSNVTVNDLAAIQLLYDRALQGEVFQQKRTAIINGATVLYADHYSSIRNTDGNITAGVVISYEVGVAL